MAKKCCYNKVSMKAFWGKRRRRQENGQTWILFSKLPFLAIFKNKYKNKKNLKKKTHIYFSVHGYSSWYTFGLHLVKGPKAL